MSAAWTVVVLVAFALHGWKTGVPAAAAALVVLTIEALRWKWSRPIQNRDDNLD
jgi:hypothetical protein